MQSYRIQKWGAVVFCIMLLWVSTASEAQNAPSETVELTHDGKPVAEIVCAEDALQIVRLAAEDLQNHVEQISGARLPIVTRPTSNVTARIFVGTNAFTEALGYRPVAYGNSGYEVVVRDNLVILSGEDRQRKPSGYLGPDGLKKWHALTGEKFGYGYGGEGTGAFCTPLGIWSNDDCGTWYAVADLLEQLGVRWYMPYEDGTVIPEIKTIRVPYQENRTEAAFGRREFCFYNAMREDGEGMRWMKRLRLGNYSLIIYNHLTGDLFGPEIQKELHPEYLACDADGKPYGGYPDGYGMPRYTDPDFRRAAALYLIKRFEVTPEVTAIAMSPPDGGIRMDARDVDLYGAPGDSLEQKTSNYIWDFHLFLARELKKVYPDKLLLYGNGTGGKLIPTNLGEVPDNIAKPFAQPYSAYRALETVNRAELETRRRWHEAIPPARKVPVWDYFLYYRTAANPRHPVVFTKSLQREMQEMLPYSDGKFIEIQPTQVTLPNGRKTSRLNTPALIHLMVYWQSRLFWNPDEDRAAMLDEYYQLFFGPAEVEMRAFYEFAEACWNRQESRSLTLHTGFLKEEDVKEFFELLSQARARAGAGSVYDRRIAAIEKEMQSLKELFLNLKRTGPELEVQTLKAPVVIDGDLSEYADDAWLTMNNNRDGKPVSENPTRVAIAFTPDKSSMIIAVECREAKMDELKADCTRRDDFSIFNDDVVEVYLNTPRRSYFKIVVNPNNSVWTESTDVAIINRDTLPILWNPDVESVVRRMDDRWTVELRIPTEDFGDLGPSREYAWGLQVGRTRFTAQTSSSQAISPTFGAYATMNKWASIWLP